MEWSVDRTTRGENARHQDDVPDFKDHSVFCLAIEGGLGEGDEALAPGAAESNVGLKGPSFPGKPVSLQGVLKAAMGESEELGVSI